MSRKILVVTVLMLVYTGTVSAQDYEFSVREDSCNDREEPIISLNDREGGNAGEPGYFKWQVCGAGVEEVNIRDECGPETNSIFSMYQRNDSHVSIYGSYRLNVCATFTASINNTCSPENRIISLVREDNSHAGAPGELSEQICATGRGEVDTVTVEMQLPGTGDVYSDGEQISEGTYTAQELEYPYLVTNEPSGIVSYGDLESITYSTEGSRTVFRVTQSSGQFIIPNTLESYIEIEDRQESIVNRNFLEQLEPSFYYPQPESPTVKVIMESNVTMSGFDQELRGPIELQARYRADNSTETVVELEPR